MADKKTREKWILNWLQNHGMASCIEYKLHEDYNREFPEYKITFAKVPGIPVVMQAMKDMENMNLNGKLQSVIAESLPCYDHDFKLLPLPKKIKHYFIQMEAL